MTDKSQNPIGNLWLNCEVVVLKTNFRQGEQSTWKDLLNRVRIGQPTEEDIKTLESRTHNLLTQTEYDNAIHIFFTNLEVLKHNTYRVSKYRL